MVAGVAREHRLVAYPHVVWLGASCSERTLSVQVVGGGGAGKGYSTRKELHVPRVPGFPTEWLILS